MAAKKTKGRYSIVGNGPYGLWCGFVRDSDAMITASKSVRIYEARNIRYWYGPSGGISSLAVYGPSEEVAKKHGGKNRIGAPAPSVLLQDVKSVIDCTPKAHAAFDAITVMP